MLSYSAWKKISLPSSYSASLGRTEYRRRRIPEQQILITGQIPKITKFIFLSESREICSFQLRLLRLDINLNISIRRWLSIEAVSLAPAILEYYTYPKTPTASFAPLDRCF